MNIAQFIPYYPNANDKNFQYDLAKHKEFYDNKMTPELGETDNEKLYPQQSIVSRFISPYTTQDVLLLYQEVGTAKKYASTPISENFKRIRNMYNEPFNPTLLLVRSDTFIKNFIRQMPLKYDYYEPKLSAPNSEIYNRRVKDLLRKYYEMETWTKFLKVSSPLKRETLENYEARLEKVVKPMWKEKFSNRVIIIDEIHNIKIQEHKKEKEEVEYLIKGGTRIAGPSTYQKMHTFLHSVVNCKILLLSGTPMWDKPNEIASIMNLILPLDNQFDSDTNFDSEYFHPNGSLLKGSVEKLKEKFKGKISYVRQTTSIVTKSIVGRINPWKDKEYDQWSLSREANKLPKVEENSYPWMKHIKIYPSVASEFQENIMRAVSKKSEKGAFRKLELDASVLVYPDGTWHSEGFNKYAVIKTKIAKRKIGKQAIETSIHRSFQLSKEFKEQVRTIEDLKKYSAKIATILEQIRDNPTKCIFIYTGDQVQFGGAIIIGLFIQHLLGYTVFTGGENKTKRYAVITHETSTPKQIENILKTFNKDENRHGEIIHVIIGSKIIAEGIDIRHIRQVHILTPWWNMSALDQAIGRVIRVGSHKALEPENQSVDIYIHTTVFQDSKGYASDHITIDLYVIKEAEEKDYKKGLIINIIKQVAIDCPLIYKRNVIKSDIDYSRECNYQLCNYQCDSMKRTGKDADGIYNYDIPNLNIVRDTYNLFYSSVDKQNISNKIIKLFNSTFSLKIQDIINIINYEDPNLILNVIDYMVDSRIRIRDQYGMISYLKEQNGIFFLDRDISYPQFISSIYTQNPMITEELSIIDFININQMKKDGIDLCKIIRPNVNIEDELNKMSHITKILIIEHIYELYANKNIPKTLAQLKYYRELWDKLKKYVYILNNNVIHIMYIEEYKGTSYNISSREFKITGKMRIYNKTTNEWVYATSDEEDKYNNEIKKLMINRMVVGFENNPYGLYGTHSKTDDKFRVITKASTKKQGFGIVCTTDNVSNIITYLLQTKYEPEQDKTIAGSVIDTMEHNNLISKLKTMAQLKLDIDDYNDNDLRKILKLVSLTKSELCDILENHLTTIDLLFQI